MLLYLFLLLLQEADDEGAAAGFMPGAEASRLERFVVAKKMSHPITRPVFKARDIDTTISLNTLDAVRAIKSIDS